MELLLRYIYTMQTCGRKRNNFRTMFLPSINEGRVKNLWKWLLPGDCNFICCRYKQENRGNGKSPKQREKEHIGLFRDCAVSPAGIGDWQENVEETGRETIKGKKEPAARYLWEWRWRVGVGLFSNLE